MNTVTLADAKNRLSELVRRAEAGEEVVVTRRGHPVARLVGPAAAVPAAGRVKGAFDRLETLRQGKVLEGDIKAMARQGLD
jgi:prevent-host-death family protein